MRTTQASPTRVILFLCLTAVVLAILPGCAEPLSEEQRLADLDYLIDIFSENHPFVSLKSRVEGYDWRAHRDEFRAWVRDCHSDREYAAAMDRIVRLVNNMHTTLRGRSTLEVWSQEDLRNIDWIEPWLRIMDGIDLGRAEYWARLASRRQFGSLMAIYSAGQYVIAERVTGTSGRSLPIGSRVIKVDGVDIDEFVRSHRGVEWQPYDPIREKTYSRVLRLPLGSHSVTAIVPDGSYVTEVFNVRASETPPSPLIPERRNGPFTLRTRRLLGCVIDGEVGYLAISQMVSDQSLLETEIRSMQEFLTSVCNLPALIIDIRGNPGGQDILWNKLVRMLISETVQVKVTVAVRDGDYVSPFYRSMIDVVGFVPLDEEDITPDLKAEISNGGFRPPVTEFMTIEPDEASVRYTGKVYLLVDDQVCSSAENFAVFSKASGFATLVGGVTGGDGFGFNLCYAVLPNSKMVVSFPLSMGLNPDGTINEEAHTRPDYLVEWDSTSIARWVYNPGRSNDVVLQECLKLAKV